MAKSDAIKFNLDKGDLDNIIARIRKLEPELQEKIFRKGMGKAGRRMLQTAKNLAPKRRGEGDSKSISSRFALSVRKTKDGRMIKAFVRNKAPHAHLMEYGFWLTKGKYFQKRIKFIGPHPAQGFMRPALNQNGQVSLDEFKSNSEEALRKLGK